MGLQHILDDARIARALAPISLGASGGIDPRDDERMDEIQLFRDECANRLPSPDECLTIVDCCIELLGTVGKDLRVAAILAYAWERAEGFIGMARAWEVIRGLLSAYWPELYPRTINDRGKNWGWYADHVAVALAVSTGRPASDDDRSALAHVRWAIGAAIATAENAGAAQLQQHLITVAKAIFPYADSLGVAAVAPDENSPSATTAPGNTSPASSLAGAGESLDTRPRVDDVAAADNRPDRLADEALADDGDPILALLPGGEVGIDLWEAYPPNDDWQALVDIVESAGYLDTGARDWAEAGRLSVDLLATTSKDIRLTNAWIVAAWRAEQLPGLARATTVARALLERHWEVMHPQRLDLRHRVLASADEAMAQEIVAALADPVAALSDEDADQSARIAADNLKALAAFADARMAAAATAPRDPQLYGRVLRTIAQPLIDAVSAADARRPAVSPPSAVARPAGPENAPPHYVAPEPSAEPVADSRPAVRPTNVAPAAAVEADRNGRPIPASTRIKGGMLAAALEIFDESASDHRAFSLIREAACWSYGDFPLAEGTDRLLAPNLPDTMFRERANSLASSARDGKHTLACALLVQCEQEMVSCPYWLDYHRIVAQSLAALGDEFSSAQAAVIGWLAGLVRRAPHLKDAAFADGTPLADDTTRQWLATEVLGTGSDGAIGRLISLPSGTSAEAALAAFRNGGGYAGGRDRFRVGIELAQFCRDHGMTVIARAVTANLNDEAQRRALDEWEPELAGSLLTLHADIWTQPEVYAATDAASRNDALGRLARIDPVTAQRMAVRSSAATLPAHGSATREPAMSD